MSRALLADARTVVVKVGSSLLASLQGGLDTRFVYRLVGELAALREAGRRPVLVSSGAVAAGTAELGMKERPTRLADIQAAAAVGQGALMRVYRDAFSYHRITVGQVLLTRDVLEHRDRFLHARQCMLALLALGVLPIVNENDTVAVEELKLKMGDNDALAASVAQLVDAEALVLLSDVPGLYDRPPSEGGASLLSHVPAVTAEVRGMAGGSVSGVGSGGMATKVNAALAASLAAIPLVVADGRRDRVLADVLSGGEVGTFFAPRKERLDARRHWIAFARPPVGALVLAAEAGASLAGGASLLPAGIREVRGEFAEGDTVSLLDPAGREIARGLASLSAEDLRLVAGRRSDEIAGALGYDGPEEAVHRDNLVVL